VGPTPRVDANPVAAMRFLDQHVGLYFPNAVTEQGFAWRLLSGVNG
jgi:hypothetical protein